VRQVKLAAHLAKQEIISPAKTYGGKIVSNPRWVSQQKHRIKNDFKIEGNGASANSIRRVEMPIYWKVGSERAISNQSI